MITLIIVDDQATVRKALRAEFELHPDLEVIGEAADGTMALSLAEAVHPAVIVMDVKMSPMDGLEAAQKLHEAGCASRIIMLSLYDDFGVRLQAQQLGASAFVGKHEPIETLLEAIRSKADNPAQ